MGDHMGTIKVLETLHRFELTTKRPSLQQLLFFVSVLAGNIAKPRMQESSLLKDIAILICSQN